MWAAQLDRTRFGRIAPNRPFTRLHRTRPERQAAVVGGGAAAGRKVGKRSAQQEAEAQQGAPQGQAPAENKDDSLEQLKKLAELRDSGILTEEEFQKQKAKLLD